MGSFATNVPATMQPTSNVPGSNIAPNARAGRPVRYPLDYPTWYRKLAGATRRATLIAVVDGSQPAGVLRAA